MNTQKDSCGFSFAVCIVMFDCESRACMLLQARHELDLGLTGQVAGHYPDVGGHHAWRHEGIPEESKTRSPKASPWGTHLDH